jgi:hypothetical protein
MSIEPSTPEIPDFVLVANPFPLPIEEVVSRAYGNCPLYDEIYGLIGGITRDGSYFEAMIYDHGRETSGFDGRLWAHTFPRGVYASPAILKSHHNGWLLFDFAACCGPENGDWKTAISKMVRILKSDRIPYNIDEEDLIEFDYTPLHPPYFRSNSMIGRPIVPVPKEEIPAPITSLSWPREAEVNDSSAYTLVPLIFSNSAMDIGNILYPLYIEYGFVGFTVRGSDAFYEIRSHHTRHNRNLCNRNQPSLKIEVDEAYNNSDLRAALPLEYNGGFLILKGDPKAAADILTRIERLTDYKYPVTEWRSTVVKPSSIFKIKRCVYVPTSTEMYNLSVDLNKDPYE